MNIYLVPSVNKLMYILNYISNDPIRKCDEGGVGCLLSWQSTRLLLLSFLLFYYFIFILFLFYYHLYYYHHHVEHTHTHSSPIHVSCSTPSLTSLTVSNCKQTTRVAAASFFSLHSQLNSTQLNIIIIILILLLHLDTHTHTHLSL